MNKIRLTIFAVLLSTLAGMARTDSASLSADSLLTLSKQCYVDDRLIEALDYATLTLRQAKKENNNQIYMEGLANIASIYGVFKDYDKAQYYFKLCLKQAKLTDDKNMTVRCYSNLTMTSCMLGNVEEAKRYLAMQEHSLVRDTTGRHHFFFLSNQGKVATAEQQWLMAVNYARQARDYAASHHLGMIYEAAETGEMASAYESLGDDSMALNLYREMLQMVMRIGDKKGASRAYEHLAKVYYRLGNEQQAAYYQQQAVQLDDSVFNAHDFNGAKGRLDDFEEEQRAEHISLLNGRIHEQLLLLLFFAFFLIVVAALAVVLVRRNRSLTAAYKLLVEKNQEAIRQSEQTVSVKEGEHLPAEQRRQLLEAIEQVMHDDETVCNPDFDMARLCTQVGSNTKYVSWVINDHYHQSFKALLNSCRIRLASKRLTDEQHYGHLTIQAIAESVGYKSQTNFIQTFKSIVGMTPSTYQRLSKEKFKNE